MNEQFITITSQEVQDKVTLLLMEEERSLDALASLGFHMPRPNKTELIYRKIIDVFNEKLQEII